MKVYYLQFSALRSPVDGLNDAIDYFLTAACKFVIWPIYSPLPCPPSPPPLVYSPLPPANLCSCDHLLRLRICDLAGSPNLRICNLAHHGGGGGFGFGTSRRNEGSLIHGGGGGGFRFGTYQTMIWVPANFLLSLIYCEVVKFAGDYSTSKVVLILYTLLEVDNDSVFRRRLAELALKKEVLRLGAATSVEEGRRSGAESEQRERAWSASVVLAASPFLNKAPKSDLDRYLEEPGLSWTQDFKVLKWWKAESPKYPMLSKMARDFLAIPMSVATSDGAFNTIPREVDSSRTNCEYQRGLCHNIIVNELRLKTIVASSLEFGEPMLCIWILDHLIQKHSNLNRHEKINREAKIPNISIQITSVMDLPTPFVRCHYQRHDYNSERNGGIYSLVTACGRLEEVAFSESLGSDPLIYYASPRFVAKFGPILPVGGAQEWLYKREMDVWISKMIFFSFLPLTFENDEVLWLVKEITTTSVDDQLMPAGLEDLFEVYNRNVWVLFKSGAQVWPVQIVDNHFEAGWDNFCRDHRLRPGFKLVLGSERKWIFDVIILNESLERVSYHWNVVHHHLVNPHPPSVAISTSCLPSVMFSDEYVFEFGYVCQARHSLNQALAVRFEGFLANEDVVEIVFRMGTKEWTVSKVNGCFRLTDLRVFVKALDLHAMDFLYFGVVEASDVRVIVFDANGVERVYMWF
ncbi:hypothetical protein Vadar_030874 [Vaccinium darrowii]|uniref:Uncharacterized protein n=1 Tax=Vaccinium darrowii TaxID=229202 RepID=A0ACB7YIA3_9ERIC|nr:hypothetical protein Vadar_030874 [Vaccinium darrowii]